MDNLSHVLTQTNLSADARFEMIQSSVTNGMPMSEVVALLGTNYTIMRPISAVVLPPGKESNKRVSIMYDLPELGITVRTTEPMLADPLAGQCAGVGRWHTAGMKGQQSPAGDVLKAAPEE